jgi:hypothetical protein
VKLPELNFTPSLDVAKILHTLLDTLEQRERRPPHTPIREASHTPRTIRVNLDTFALPAYHSQADPAPRQIANSQFQELEWAGLVKLNWLPGETGHLLASVTLVPEQAEAIFKLINRTPQSAHRVRLTNLLLGERFRFYDWRLHAVQHALAQLKAERSPAPFSLSHDEFNRDLLTALVALDGITEETPYRVFSVRVFNDSKRYEAVMGAVATLARRNQREWTGLSNDEVLRELNLVPNPTHLYLHGAWQLVDDTGQMISLSEFHPSVGLPSAQAAKLQRAIVETPPVICVENPTSFYELTRNIAHSSPASPFGTKCSAAICLWGNPSPACRHLLRCLPEEFPLFVWADMDYGGLNILAQLREQVNPKTMPYLMDVETLERHARWARPLSPADTTNLTRLLRRSSLADMHPLITHLLQRGLKLEQEAVVLNCK